VARAFGGALPTSCGLFDLNSLRTFTYSHIAKMPVDYSKWDALELSDDSDIEVHPNVDKRSFIRAKQSQIHQTRAQRRHHIETLQYEDIVNQGLLIRINRLLTALKSHKTDTASLEEVVLRSTIESLGDIRNDKPSAPPPGVHANAEPITYSKMMGSLIDQVKTQVENAKPEKPLEAFIDGVTEHKDKVDGLQVELHKKLDELEKEERKHITSNDIRPGFDYSKVCIHIRIQV
jgi:cell division cycle protein 37